jgi:predicted transcriptional regulator
MEKMKRLPEAEFAVMKAAWELEPPITTSMLMERIDAGRGWRLQTLISHLSRLVEKRFLKTEKISKERFYYPLVSKEDYLKFETRSFVETYHDRSIVSLVNTLLGGREGRDESLDELEEWLKKKRGGK